MDLEYLDPFNTTCPHGMDKALNEEGDHGLICAMELSPCGMWLATGNTDGECQVWDMLTNSVLLSIEAPSGLGEKDKAAVQSISWNLARKAILIAYECGLLSEWKIEERAYGGSWRTGRALLLTTYSKTGTWLVADEDRTCVIDEGVILHEVKAEDPSTSAAFCRGSNTLLVGNGKGEIVFYDAENLDPLGKSSEVGSPVLRIITHHSKAGMILVMLKDKERSIKLFRVVSRTELQMHLKFVDVINRSMWATAGFSHDGELAFGANKEMGNHSIYLWELVNGTITRTLEGPREDVVDIKWHPKRPIMISLSKFGICYVWRPQYPKKWSALFPGMTEVEENVYYTEREDEFDEIQEHEDDKGEEEPACVDIKTLLPSVTKEDLLEVSLFVRCIA